LPQTAYLALNTPYVLFGLGRSSNYIEEFFYGIPINQVLRLTTLFFFLVFLAEYHLLQAVHYNYWIGSTIPNSQVVAIPYKPSEPLTYVLMNWS
jgi:integrin alpha FG-GAP repeat containing protein 1